MRTPLTKLLVVGLLLFSGIFAGFFIYNRLVFRVTGTSPSTDSISFISPYFAIHFNHELRDQDLDVTISPSTTYYITVDSSTLYINFNELTRNQSYKVTIKNIQDLSNNTIENLEYSFVAQSISYTNLSQQEKDELLKRQDGPTTENSNPIMGILPHSTLHYNLKGVVVSGGDAGDGVIQVEAEIILYNSDINTGKDAAVSEYKSQITNYFTDNDIDINNYVVNYSITELY